MSVFTALYTLLIGPLELFFEVLFSMANRVLENPGLSIIFLSLAMNFLVLPLYKMADEIQAEEQATEAKLKHWVTHIKKTFKGDERFMMLQTYYRQNNYKPTDPLKGSISLLLEIPFFMAAYNFLSGLSLLQGASFGPIQNLGVPDGMLVIGGVAVNLLPILMTAINLISSAIYTKNASFRSKVQLYVMAGLFLVLLYDSPSGLVFYWTLNNLFSLVKNVFMKLKNPKKVFGVMASVVSVVMTVVVLIIQPMYSVKGQVMACVALQLLHVPLIMHLVSGKHPMAPAAELTRKEHLTFVAGSVFMTVLTGLLIPAGVINASPEEFMNAVTHRSPLFYILNSTLTAAGFFLIWFGIFYLLARNRGKRWMGYGICAFSVISVVNFMFFGHNSGNMSSELIFDLEPTAEMMQQLLNLALCAALAAVVYLIWHKKQEILRVALMTFALAGAVMSVVNFSHISTVTSAKQDEIVQAEDAMPVLPMSRDGKNVIVLMMDRGVGTFVPFMFNEKPELQEQFAGFTYYPNTISYGAHTNFGAPALFGGYEYTPEELNSRTTEILEDKHNESLRMMPVAFLEEGYEVTVCDPPLAGYDWIPDLTIFDDYPDIHTFRTRGRFNNDPIRSARRSDQKRNRNFFCYSLYKTAPLLLQPTIYNSGRYNELGGISDQNGPNLDSVSPTFLEAYEVLKNLNSITDIREDGKNTFLMLTNDTTHEPTLLQEPAYEPAEFTNNEEYEREHADRFELGGKRLKMENDFQFTHYQVNMAAFLKLGDWFDYLREQGIYDNTRIIIVADHGQGMENLPSLPFDDGKSDDMMYYTPMLLFKDFGSTELTMDTSFMTNADTPTLAMEGVIANPVNPFTGKPITNAPKFDGPQHIICSHEYDVSVNNGTAYLPDYWYSVHDDVYNIENWEYLGYK